VAHGTEAFADAPSYPGTNPLSGALHARCRQASPDGWEEPPEQGATIAGR